jgi:thiamine pyrophosphate-dependent acetolactate synthase large subunit-like protein
MKRKSGESPMTAMQDVERPAKAGQFEMAWGSDVPAHMLREFDIPYIALNPGASYRGFHDSLVNYLGNRDPQMLVVLHEEHAVAMAHGYAKVTGQPMAVALHSNVGLMHATMAIFNAWCDRVPILMLGATGPVDASERRPWIEWIHTAKDQGALIRDYVKWDDQPASAGALVESMLRAWQIMRTAPRAPVYVCLDMGLQESKLDAPPSVPAVSRFGPGDPPSPGADAVEAAAQLLNGADRPLIMAGRVSRDPADWQRRIELAELLDARVVTDLKAGAAFPTDHRLHVVPPIKRPNKAAGDVLAAADAVLALDWIDPMGTFQLATGEAAIEGKMINCTVDSYIHNGWSMDHHLLPPADIRLLCEPDVAVSALLAELKKQGKRSKPGWSGAPDIADSGSPHIEGELDYHDMAEALTGALDGRPSCLIRVPLGWPGDALHFRDPLDFLGGDGGAGIGSGPGMAVGGALALKGTGRLPIAILGDGDSLMGLTALWTATKYRIPLLVIVANNRSYFNDELHQERVADGRDRPPENRWIGQRIEDPDPNFVQLATGFGWEAEGPVNSSQALSKALVRGVERVEAGGCYLIDVEVARYYGA